MYKLIRCSAVSDNGAGSFMVVKVEKPNKKQKKAAIKPYAKKAALNKPEHAEPWFANPFMTLPFSFFSTYNTPFTGVSFDINGLYNNI